jgi:hypothetical protein
VQYENPNPEPRCQRSTFPLYRGFIIGKPAVVLSRTSCNTDFRVPKPRSLANAPPGLHYASGSHAAKVVFGTSRIADPRYQVPAVGNPECRNSDGSDLCHLSLQRSTAQIKSGDRTSRFLTCMRSLRSPTPIRRWAMTNDPPCA